MNTNSSRLPLIAAALGVLALTVFLCFLAVGGLVIWRFAAAPAAPVGEIIETTPEQPPTPVAPAVSDSTDIETQINTRVYQQAAPSVVAVQVLDEDMLGKSDESDKLHPFFFSTGEGSGFVIDKEGHILTNNHVIEDAESVVVTFYDGLQAPAEIIGSDQNTDLAVIKVDPQGLNLRPVTFGDIDNLQVGDRLLVIGNPFGNANTLTTGIVSALGRLIDLPESFYSLPEVIQTDAAINPGNSGGPMLNARGEVVGVTFMLQSETRSNSGIGFGIPSYFARRVSHDIIETGAFRHPYIGIRGVTLSPFAARALGLQVDRGVLVKEVLQDTPADKAGLRGGEENETIEGLTFKVGGDVITAIDGQPVLVFDDLLAYLGRYSAPGDTITLTVHRNGKTLEIPLTLAPRP